MAVTSTDIVLATVEVVTEKLAVLVPAATTIEAGTVTTEGSLLPSDTEAPPAGAAAFRMIVPVMEAPPPMLEGLNEIEETVTVGFGTNITGPVVRAPRSVRSVLW